MRIPNQMAAAALLFVTTTYMFAAEALDTTKTNVAAAGMDKDRLAQIPIRMKEYVDNNKAAGIVTAVARHRHAVSFEAVGYQDLQAKKPMSKDSMFRIASLTKPITCAGVMVLVDEGKISTIDPVEKYLPEYKGLKMKACGARSGYACQSVTPTRPMNIEDLMTHMSGLPAGASPRSTNANTLAELVTLGAKTDLLFEPGTNWNYSNIGIDILGRIIEVVSHESFEGFLDKHLFQPLGMKDTCFFVPSEKQSRLAKLYTQENEGLKLAGAEWGEPQQAKIPHPAGGLVSTAVDILRFNEMMRQKGKLDGRRVLSEAATRVMTISHTGDL